MPVQDPGAPLPILFPANDGLSTWALATHERELDGVTGSWLWSDPGPAIAAIWGLSQQMEARSLARSLSLAHSTFKKKNKSS